MSVALAISDAAQETGALLTQYLKDRGIYDPYSGAVVCYGVNPGGRTNFLLNGNCKSNKIKRMLIMNKAGVQTVPWFRAEDWKEGLDVKFPLLARKITGHGGTDIVPVFQAEEVEWRIAAGWDWFSEYIPMQNEYRAWVFRGECLDIYDKVMQRPHEYKYIGRNFRSGFEFRHCSKPITDVAKIAINAVEALKLDFGAVDLVRAKDGSLYILEVNTAPGVLRSKAEATLAKLANKIQEWDKKGYPEW